MIDEQIVEVTGVVNFRNVIKMHILSRGWRVYDEEMGHGFGKNDGEMCPECVVERILMTPPGSAPSF